MFFKTILSALALNSVSAGFNSGFGFCDPFGPETVKDFKVDDYMGNWYQIAQDKEEAMETKDMRDCTTM